MGSNGKNACLMYAVKIRPAAGDDKQNLGKNGHIMKNCCWAPPSGAIAKSLFFDRNRDYQNAPRLTVFRTVTEARSHPGDNPTEPLPSKKSGKLTALCKVVEYRLSLTAI